MLPKFIKAFLISVVLILGGLGIYNSTLPEQVKILRSTSINNVKVSDVFEEVAIMRNRAHWSPWSAKDSLMNASFSGPAYGVGSRMEWSGDPEITGNGSIEIVDMVLNQSIQLELIFEDYPPTEIYWTFVAKGADVEVNWSSVSNLPYMYRFIGPLMEENAGQDFEEGLKRLKDFCENKKDDYQIELVDVAAMNVYSSKAQTTADQIGNSLGVAFGKIVHQMMADKQVQLSMPMAYYHNWDGMNVELEAAIPVAKVGNATADVMAKTIPATKAIRGIHIGPYDATQGIYDALHNYMDMAGLKQNGSPWELYVTDPGKEPDPSKWVTEIYFPIK